MIKYVALVAVVILDTFSNATGSVKHSVLMVNTSWKIIVDQELKVSVYHVSDLASSAHFARIVKRIANGRQQ